MTTEEEAPVTETIEEAPQDGMFLLLTAKSYSYENIQTVCISVSVVISFIY